MNTHNFFPIFHHAGQCLIERIHWFPTRIFMNLARAAKDNSFVGWAHQVRNGPDFRVHTGYTDRFAQKFTNLIRPGCTEVVSLTTLPFCRSEIETAVRVIDIEKRPAWLQVPDFDYWRLQSFLDADQLPDEIRWRIVLSCQAPSC